MLVKKRCYPPSAIYLAKERAVFRAIWADISPLLYCSAVSGSDRAAWDCVNPEWAPYLHIVKEQLEIANYKVQRTARGLIISY